MGGGPRPPSCRRLGHEPVPGPGARHSCAGLPERGQRLGAVIRATGLGRQLRRHGTGSAVREGRTRRRGLGSALSRSVDHPDPGAGPRSRPLRRRADSRAGARGPPDDIAALVGSGWTPVPVPLGRQGSHRAARSRAPGHLVRQGAPGRSQRVLPGGAAGGQWAARGDRRAGQPADACRHAGRSRPRRVPRKVQRRPWYGRGARRGRRGDRRCRRTAPSNLADKALQTDRRQSG